VGDSLLPGFVGAQFPAAVAELFTLAKKNMSADLLTKVETEDGTFIKI